MDPSTECAPESHMRVHLTVLREKSLQATIYSKLNLMLFHLKPSFRSENMRIGPPEIWMSIIRDDVYKYPHSLLDDNLTNKITVCIHHRVMERNDQVFPSVSDVLGYYWMKSE